MWHNDSIERMSSGKPAAAAHVERSATKEEARVGF
jgi:hypothetical protein